MSFTSDPFIVGSRSRTDASAVPETTTAPTARPPLDILTYYYGSRMVYVSPGEDYDRAIDIAVESFPKLRDVERHRICLEVHVMHSHQRTVEIGRTAWPFLVLTLSRFDLVGIRVSPLSMSASASASSSSGIEPMPYDWETGWSGYSDTRESQTNLVAYRTQIPYSPSPSQPHPHTTRVVVDLVPSKSSRDRHSPQPRQRHHF